MKMLNGVIDDRGKYIFINETEMEVRLFNNNLQTIYKSIVSKGIFSKKELIEECSRLIRLEPTDEQKARIKAEENKLQENLNTDFKEIESQA